jgi:hypothetical protein
MRIEYETTLDEIVYTHLRVAQQSTQSRRLRRQTTCWMGVFTWLVVFVLLGIYNLTPVQRSVLASLGAVVIAAVTWRNYPRNMRKHILRCLQDGMPASGRMHVSVELREDCIWTKQGHTQLSFDWTNVREIVDSADGIEFLMRDGGYVMVRSKGFPNHETRENFKEIVSNRIESSSDRGVADDGHTRAVQQ